MAYHQHQDLRGRRAEITIIKEFFVFCFCFCYNDKDENFCQAWLISYLHMCNPSCATLPGLLPAASLLSGLQASMRFRSGYCHFTEPACHLFPTKPPEVRASQSRLIKSRELTCGVQTVLGRMASLVFPLTHWRSALIVVDVSILL